MVLSLKQNLTTKRFDDELDVFLGTNMWVRKGLVCGVHHNPPPPHFRSTLCTKLFNWSFSRLIGMDREKTYLIRLKRLSNSKD
jgi:hypothetical protein